MFLRRRPDFERVDGAAAVKIQTIDTVHFVLAPCRGVVSASHRCSYKVAYLETLFTNIQDRLLVFGVVVVFGIVFGIVFAGMCLFDIRCFLSTLLLLEFTSSLQYLYLKEGFQFLIVFVLVSVVVCTLLYVCVWVRTCVCVMVCVCA